jgi:hypothetical protein
MLARVRLGSAGFRGVLQGSLGSSGFFRFFRVLQGSTGSVLQVQFYGILRRFQVAAAGFSFEGGIEILSEHSGTEPRRT